MAITTTTTKKNNNKNNHDNIMTMQLPIQPKIKIRNNNSDNDTMEVIFPITPRAIIWVSDTAKPPPDLPPSLLRSFLFLIQLLPLLGARNFVAHPPPPHVCNPRLQRIWPEVLEEWSLWRSAAAWRVVFLFVKYHPCRRCPVAPARRGVWFLPLLGGSNFWDFSFGILGRSTAANRWGVVGQYLGNLFCHFLGDSKVRYLQGDFLLWTFCLVWTSCLPAYSYQPPSCRQTVYAAVTYQGTCDSTAHGTSLLGYFVLWIPAEPTSLAIHLPAAMFEHP